MHTGGNIENGGPGVSPGGQDPPVQSTDLVLDLLPQALNLGAKIPVLVSLVYPTDRAKQATPEARDRIVKVWEDVAVFYRQASFGAKEIVATVTDWHPLAGDAAEYITNDPEMFGPNIRDDQAVLTMLCCEAARAATLEGKALDDYRIIACIINLDENIVDGKPMPPLRGYSDRSASRFRDAALGIDICLRAPMGVIAVDERAGWARCAHELGHFLLTPPTRQDDARVPAAFNAEDLYDDSEGCADASASGFDLMGHHDDRPLFSGYNMEQLGFYPPDRILEVAWNCDRFSQEYNVAAHGLSPDAIPAAPDWHYLLKIPVSDNLIYYIEARQKPGSGDAQVFDPKIGLMDLDFRLSDDENLGGILVTRVLRGRVSTSQQMRYITVKHEPCRDPYPNHVEPHTLAGGGVARDLASGLTVEVIGKPLRARPLVYRVRVSWDKDRALGFLPPAADKPLYNKFSAYGQYNLYLRQRSTADEAWECPDMWIEREPFHDDPRQHPWDYGWDEAEGKPRYCGDRPVRDRKHRVWARVRCEGYSVDPAGANEGIVRDVAVRLFDLLPPFTGLPLEIGRAVCDVKIGGYTDVCLPGSGEGRSWQPASSNTVWLVVDVNHERTADERDSCDNTGRVVVFDHECSYAVRPASGNDLAPPPFTIEVPVYNPSKDMESTIWLAVGVDHGPEKGPVDSDVFKVDFPDRVVLGPGEKTTVGLIVRPSGDYLLRNSIDGQHSRIRVLQYMLYPGPAASGTGGIPRVPIRGLTYWVSLKQAVKLSLTVSPGKSGLNRAVVEGVMTPATGNKEKCFIDLAGDDERAVVTQIADIQPDGTFGAAFEGLAPGAYKARAFITCSKYAAQAWSEPVDLKINEKGEIVP